MADNLLLQFKKFFLGLFFSFSFFACSSSEILFFNVGEGHCTLVHQEDCVPLLIDAGSRKRIETERKLEQTLPFSNLSQQDIYIVENVADTITSYWVSPDTCNLNIILTHGDQDHISYVPHLLEVLKGKRDAFKCQILLGGDNNSNHYSSYFLDSLRRHLNPALPDTLGDKLYYSSYFSGQHIGETHEAINLRFTNNLRFLDSSGCITHLFCPRGKKPSTREFKNSWSIITRIELSQPIQPTNDDNTKIAGLPLITRRLSAILTGDADKKVQENHLTLLGRGRCDSLRSDILLYPHHGADLLHGLWIQAIDPQAVVISSGRCAGIQAHPKAKAIESLFWQGELTPPTRPTFVVHELEQKFALINLPELITPNPTIIVETQQIEQPSPPINLYAHNRLERIWNAVNYHKIVYYGTIYNHQTIQRKLPISRYTGFDFINDNWYTDFGLDEREGREGWGCALVNFPIYTLYSSGSLKFSIPQAPFAVNHYNMHEIDPISETDWMIRCIADNLLDDPGDFKLLHLLPHKTKREVYKVLKEKARNIQEAEKILFLCFVVIPNIEGISKTIRHRENCIKLYREKNLVNLLNYFLDRTQGLNFNELADRNFFKTVEDNLFNEVEERYEKHTKLILPFIKRQFLFNAFLTGPHLQENEAREDLLYLYYLIYSYIHENYIIDPSNLQDMIQNIRHLPFRKLTDTNCPNNSLEIHLKQAIYIYNTCNENDDEDEDDQDYYEPNIVDLPLLIQVLYRHNLPNNSVEAIGKILEVLPPSFNIPVHTTVDYILTHSLLPTIETVRDFESLTSLLGNYLSIIPAANQLESLAHFVKQLCPVLTST